MSVSGPAPPLSPSGHAPVPSAAINTRYKAPGMALTRKRIVLSGTCFPCSCWSCCVRCVLVFYFPLKVKGLSRMRGRDGKREWMVCFLCVCLFFVPHIWKGYEKKRVVFVCLLSRGGMSFFFLFYIHYLNSDRQHNCDNVAVTMMTQRINSNGGDIIGYSNKTNKSSKGFQ